MLVMTSMPVIKAFPFDTSAQVLAFSIQAEEVAGDAAVKASIRQRFGGAMVMLAEGGAEGVYLRVIEKLDRAASAVRAWQPTVGTQKASRVKRGARVVAVVDDEPCLREVASWWLMNAGFAVEAFASAADFLENRGWQRCCCLVTDLQMPGMGGIELQEHLLDQGTSVPVLVMTGCHDPTMRARAVAAGAGAFCQKPVDGRALVATVRELSERHTRTQ